ncbi:MAG: insulinase family protein [Clostridiales bacterium]|nr:insulinase family protein [Clostridiales bacterium]
MKRTLSLFICLALLAGLLGFAPAETDGAYTLKATRRFELVGADVSLYEHNKTGALVMFLNNSDTNRTFQIAFRTPAYTDKGIAHVLEHSVLGGSKKYPSRGLFTSLSTQTYNTYMNAYTANYMTAYPVASLSEEQLLMFADFYTDSVFNPMVLEDSDIFSEEAWRYTLDAPEAELGIEGTVYSEMQGSYTLARAARLNYYNTVFPGSTRGRDSGGIPEVIYTMKWEDVTEFYKEYYHPSNSFTVIYGDIQDENAFLTLLDGYFSAYEKKEFVITEDGYTPITESIKAEFAYPVANGSDTDKQANVYYGLVTDCAYEDLDELDYLTTLLADDSGYFVQTLKRELPGASGACYVDSSTPEISVMFIAQGVNREDADTFKRICDEAIKDAAENGFDADAVDAIVSGYNLSIQLIGEEDELNIDMVETIADYWALRGDMFGYMEYIDRLDSFKEKALDGSMSRAAEKYLLGNERTVLAVTYPEPGMLESKTEAFKAQLQADKAQMSEEEIQSIIAYKPYDKDALDDTTKGLITQLTAATTQSLPEDTRVYDISDETDEDGIRFVTVDAKVDGVGETALMLDASGLKQEQLHYFKLLCDVLGELDTQSHTKQEISTLSSRYLYDGIIKVSVMGDLESASPYMRLTFTALDEDLDEGYGLLYELLYETKLDDAGELLKLVKQLKTSLRATISQNCYAVMLYRAEGAFDATTSFFSYVTYIDYYEFLEKTEQLLESDPEKVIGELKAIQQYFNNRYGAIAGFTGSQASAEVNRAAAKAFLMKLDEREITPETYAIDNKKTNEALIIDGTVNYNMVFASWKELGLDGYDGAMDAVASFVYDNYLYNMLRVQYGAYGVLHGSSDSGVYIITYRDPNIDETFEVYASLGELIAKDSPAQEELDGYILSAYSSYAKSGGELSGGFSALLNYLDGESQEKTLERMRALKGVTPDVFKTYSGLYEKLFAQGAQATSGGAAAIEAQNRYERVLNPFGVKDLSKAELTDVSEGSVYYDAVKYVMAEGSMVPMSETEFGSKQPAAIGDLAVSVYLYYGGPYDPQGAVDWLAGYELLPQVNAGQEITRAEAAYYTYFVLAGLGVELDMPEEITLSDAEAIGGDMAPFAQIMCDNELMLADDGVFRPDDILTREEMAYIIFTIFAE